MIYIILTIVFVLLAAISKAVQDTLQFHYYQSVFSKLWKYEGYLNPMRSWENKYSNTETSKPKFFGSTTLLVFLTDGFHLAQFFFLLFIFAAIVSHETIVPLKENLKILSLFLDFTILRVIFGLVFELFYSKIFRK